MTPSQDYTPEKDESEMTESEYEDMVWLTRKAVRSKLKKWRKDTTKKKDIEEDREKEEDVALRTCKTCYFCSYVRELNKIWYVRCTLEEPRWRVAEDGLPCWKKKI